MVIITANNTIVKVEEDSLSRGLSALSHVRKVIKNKLQLTLLDLQVIMMMKSKKIIHLINQTIIMKREDLILQN